MKDVSTFHAAPHNVLWWTMAAGTKTSVEKAEGNHTAPCERALHGHKPKFKHLNLFWFVAHILQIPRCRICHSPKMAAEHQRLYLDKVYYSHLKTRFVRLNKEHSYKDNVVRRPPGGSDTLAAIAKRHFKVCQMAILQDSNQIIRSVICFSLIFSPVVHFIGWFGTIHTWKWSMSGSGFGGAPATGLE